MMDICRDCGWEIKNPRLDNYYNQKPICDDCNRDRIIKQNKEQGIKV